MQGMQGLYGSGPSFHPYKGVKFAPRMHPKELERAARLAMEASWQADRSLKSGRHSKGLCPLW